MATPTDFFTIGGFFTLRNGHRLEKSVPSGTSHVTVYDTKVYSASGISLGGKIFIAKETLYPDESRVCVVATVGPMEPFGFLINAICLIADEASTINMFQSYHRVSAGGVVSTEPLRGEDGMTAFMFSTKTSMSNNTWSWTFK